MVISIGREQCSDAVTDRCGGASWVSAGLCSPVLRVQLVFFIASPAGQQQPQAYYQMLGCEPTQVVATQTQQLPIDLSMSSPFVVLFGS